MRIRPRPTCPLDTCLVLAVALIACADTAGPDGTSDGGSAGGSPVGTGGRDPANGGGLDAGPTASNRDAAADPAPEDPEDAEPRRADGALAGDAAQVDATRPADVPDGGGPPDAGPSPLTGPWMQPPGPRPGLPTDGLACDDSDLLAKYFRYRRRLRGDGTAAHPGFVSFGSAPGESIVASRREPTVDCAGHWLFETCPVEDEPDARGLYKWGDGTIWLGEHLAVLGLEHALFRSLGVPTAETESDIRQLLAAFDRLDARAEAYYPEVAGRLDGFFVRDDVPRGFTRRVDGAWRFPRDDGWSGYECAGGDLLCDPPRIDGGAFTSQDQTIGLMFGLAQVALHVPPGTRSEGVDLRETARAQFHRIVMHLRDNGWRVTDPDGNSPPDAWGGNATGFSSVIAKSANAICGADFGVDDYRDGTSRTAGEAAWTGIQAIWDTTHGYNRTMALRLAAMSDVWAPDKMARNAARDGKDVFAMIHAIAHGADLVPHFADWRIEALLRSAPCGGPCRGTVGCANKPGWLGESRTSITGDRFGSRHHPVAEFNGLDYMLTFAAWHLYREGLWQLRPLDRDARPCAPEAALDRVLALGVDDGTTWDPTDPCRAQDLRRTFCDRPLGAWLHDAAQGRVNVFAGGARWACEPAGVCTLHADLDGHTDADDLILGTPGADTLDGGDGHDCVVGLGGDDVLFGGRGYDHLDGGPGEDILLGERDGVVLDGEADVLRGGPGDDTLQGGPGRDELVGDAGRDTLDGGGGADFLHGGDDDDTLSGGGGGDHLDGGDGDDALVGDLGDDVLWGGAGRDKLDGEGGADYLHGGTGPDFLRGGDGDDTLISGDQQGDRPRLDEDRLCGNGGDDVLWGGWDGDACLGGGLLGGQDTVNGCEDGTARAGECDNGAFRDW